MNSVNHGRGFRATDTASQQALLRLLLFWLGVVAWSLGGQMLGAESDAAGRDSTEFKITAWSTEDGLPANSISSVLRTRDGYLWVGSSQGVARFDGETFKVFNKANCPALPDNRIRGLFETDAELLIATERGGLVCLKEGKFTRVTETAKPGDHIVACLKGATNDWLLASYTGTISRWSDGRLEPVSRSRMFGPVLPRWVIRDGQGWVWLLANESRLMVSRGGEFTPFRFTGTLTNTSCLGMTLDREGVVWVATENGIARWGGSDFEVVSLPGWSTNRICRDIFASRDGGFWIGMQNNNFRKLKSGSWAGPEIHASGVRTFVRVLGEDTSGRLILGGRTPEGLLFMSESAEIVRLTQQNGLPGNTVAAHQIDAEGNMWLGLADGGLVRLRSRLFTELPGAASLQSAPSQAICEARDGSVWMGTSMGGVYRFSDAGVDHYSNKDGFPVTLALSICEDRNTNLWVGTSWHGAYLFVSNRFVQVYSQTNFPGRINSICEDGAGVLWFGCGAGLVSLRDGKIRMEIPPNISHWLDIKTLLPDAKGRLWIGTDNRGLWCWSDGRVQPVLTNGFAASPIWSLFLDGDGAIWIGSQGRGLGRLFKGQLDVFPKVCGLWDDTLTYIAEDSAGRFWFGSPRGVFRVARNDLLAYAAGLQKTVTCAGYAQADGMPSTECQGGFQPAGWMTRNGRFLFSTLRGVAVINPDSLVVNPLPPAVLIEEVRLDDNELPLGLPDEIVVVPPGKRRLEIQFTGLSLVDAKRVRFKCRLQGLEEDWVDLGSRRHVTYSYLKPGSYLFELRACNNDGLWNEKGAALRLSVQPHFWETWWFVMALGSSCILGVVAIVRRVEQQRLRLRMERLTKERQIEHERSRIARDIHDDLGARLTRMAVISELIKADKLLPDAVEAHANKIAATSNEAVMGLDAIVWAVNPRNDTLDSLVQYLSHFAYDFFQMTAVTCELIIPEDVPPVPLNAEVRHNLFMVAKEAMNNVVKHSGASRVTLRVQVRAGNLEIQVSDNGRGFDVAAAVSSQRSGLRNMKQRLAAVGGELQIQSTAGQGATIGITLHLHAGVISGVIRQECRDGTID